MSKLHDTRDANVYDTLAFLIQLSFGTIPGEPFFNLWPVLEECLMNTRLDIDPGLIERGIIHELGAVEVRPSVNSKLPTVLRFCHQGK